MQRKDFETDTAPRRIGETIVGGFLLLWGLVVCLGFVASLFRLESESYAEAFFSLFAGGLALVTGRAVMQRTRAARWLFAGWFLSAFVYLLLFVPEVLRVEFLPSGIVSLLMGIWVLRILTRAQSRSNREA